MRNIIRSVFFLAMVIFFASCQKDLGLLDPINPGGTTVSYKIKTYTEAYSSSQSGSFSNTYKVAYDANNRMISLTDSANPGFKFVYTYNTNNTYTFEIFDNGLLSIHGDAYLNSLSLIDSSFQYNNTNDSFTEKYIYNAQKQLIKLKEYDYSIASGAQLSNTSDYTYDSNGNLLQEKDSDGTIIKYEYGTELNTINLNIFHYNNKYLVTKTTYTDSNQDNYISNHTYTFDSNHRILSEKETFDSGEVLVRSYTY